MHYRYYFFQDGDVYCTNDENLAETVSLTGVPVIDTQENVLLPNKEGGLAQAARPYQLDGE